MARRAIVVPAAAVAAVALLAAPARALIASPQDLGAVPSLFGKPSAYARFLGAELRFVYRGRLLVVMPQGAALSQRGRLLDDPTVRAAKPGASGESLAETALGLVRRLAPALRGTSSAKTPSAVERFRPAPGAAPRRRGPAGAAAPLLSSGPIRPSWLPADLSTHRAAEIASGLVGAFVALGLCLVLIGRRRFSRRLPPAIDMGDPYRYRGP